METHLVLADHHIPFQDEGAIACAHEIGRRAKASTVWLLGDVIDFAPISRFRDAARYTHTVQDEIDETVAYIKRVRRAFPHAAIRYMLGNHERRLQYYLWNDGPKIKDLRTTRFDHQFRYDAKDKPLNLGVTFHDLPVTFAKKAFLLKHGNRACLYSTRWECDDEGRSGMSGHIHHTGQWTWSTPGGGLRTWYSVGCLCGLDPPYREPGQPFHWNHGCGTLAVADRSVGVENVIIDGGVAHYRGARYSAS